jgi:hypothetical protein
MAKTVSDTADRGSEMVCYVIEKMRDISGSSDRIADILSAAPAGRKMRLSGGPMTLLLPEEKEA